MHTYGSTLRPRTGRNPRHVMCYDTGYTVSGDDTEPVKKTVTAKMQHRNHNAKNSRSRHYTLRQRSVILSVVRDLRVGQIRLRAHKTEVTPPTTAATIQTNVLRTPQKEGCGTIERLGVNLSFSRLWLHNRRPLLLRSLISASRRQRRSRCLSAALWPR